MTALEAIFNKATTTIDGGWNLTFALSDDMADKVTEVTRLREERLYVVVMTEGEYLATQNRKKTGD